MESPFKHTIHYKEAWEGKLIHVTDEPFITCPLHFGIGHMSPIIGYTRHPMPTSLPPRLSDRLEAC